MAKEKELKNADAGQETSDQDKPARKSASARRKDPTPSVEPIRTVEATTPEPVEAVEPEKPKPENARWYAIHTYSGHEAKVSRNILLRADYEGLSHLIVRTFIPEEEEMRVVAGKTRKVKRKLFPGYVFIEMVLDDPTIQLVKSTTGVTGFLSSGNKPISLKENEVRHLEDLKEGKQPPRVEFEKGDIVRVTQGPFAEFTGKIDEVMIDKQKLRVLIELFGRDTPVELAFNEVDKEIADPSRKH